MRKGAILPVMLATLAAGAAQAQPVTFDLGEIVLSPNRTPVERARTGASVTVLDAPALAEAPGGLAAEALARAPGVSFTGQGPFGNVGTLRIRGADVRYIATHVEGIRIDDPTGTNVSTSMGLIAGPGLGRAEILRGSQSALWGGSVVGGVVTLAGPQVARDGLSQTFEAEAGGHGT
jgi:vitamin B12 transporter